MNRQREGTAKRVEQVLQRRRRTLGHHVRYDGHTHVCSHAQVGQVALASGQLGGSQELNAQDQVPEEP